MNQVSTINVVQGDQGYVIQFYLQNTDGSAFDLTGFTATINGQAVNSSGTKFSHSITVNSPNTEGLVSYTVQSGDFNEKGQVNASIVVNNASSNITVTFPNIQFIVQAAIPTF